jgi:SSS family solute:Na+ symporter
MFFYITGSIYIGGVGPVIVGGLYWKRGTTLAAWISMIYGSVISVGFILLQQIYMHKTGESLPINAFYVTFAIGWSAVVLYAFISLLGKKQDFNISRMLHRGKYAREDDPPGPIDAKGLKVVGYTRTLPFADKLTYWFAGLWFFGWFLLFIVLVIFQHSFGISDDSWARVWQYYLWITFTMAVLVSIWFLIGGMKDVKNLFVGLREAKIDDTDDGSVIGSHSRTDKYVEDECRDTV